MLPAVEAAGGEIVDCQSSSTGPAGSHDADLAGDRPGLSAASALWILDLPTYEPGPATCPRCAAGEPLHAPGSTGTPAGAAWHAGASRSRRAGTRWPPSSSPAGRVDRRSGAGAGVHAAARDVGSAGPGGAASTSPGSPVVGAGHPVDAERLDRGQGLHPPDDDGDDLDVRDRHARERRRVPAGSPDRAPGGGRAGPGLLPRPRTASSVAYRLEDADRRGRLERTALADGGDRRLELVLRDDASNEPRTMPSLSTTKTHGSDRRPQACRGVGRLELARRRRAPAGACRSRTSACTARR